MRTKQRFRNKHSIWQQRSDQVTFMLSWAPDTNHIGVYVAKNKGYFKEAGLDVDIVAVAQAGAEQAVNNGVADFALSNLTNVSTYAVKGATIKQVLQVQQKPSAIWCSSLPTLKSNPRRISTARLSPRSDPTNPMR